MGDSSPPRRKAISNESSPLRTKVQKDLSPPRKSQQDIYPPRKSMREEKLSSGHSSGLQTGTEFGKNEKRIRESSKLELSTIDSSITGKDSETIYRDKKGRKLDMATEFMRSQAIKEGKDFKIQQAQYEWGVGAVQKQQAIEKIEELKEIADEPFARTEDDPKLERMRKEALRDGDPMANYVIEKRVKKERKQKKHSRSSDEDEEVERNPNHPRLQAHRLNAKPLYSGPAPPPNRFHIRPGYRWDGIDRGSEFERKLSNLINNSSSLREDQYKWSVSDL